MTTLPQLLSQSVLSNRSGPAVCHEGQTLTYAELDDLSTRLAKQLAQLGVSKGDTVGVWLPKSLAAVVAIYGILKAGAAHVPIMDTAPPRRAALIARDCKMKILLTDTKAASVPAAFDACDTQLIDLDLTKLDARDGHTTLPIIGPEDLAYILYTSGSTGTPKGVMTTHTAALHFVDWAYGQFQIVPEDRLANLAPLSFDLSVFDIFVAARAGACVHLISPMRAMFPTALSSYVSEHALTIWYSVPSALARLPEHGQLEKHSLASLRHVIFAGEPFPVPQLKRLIDAVPNAQFHNLYGPTETNVVSHFKVDQLGAAPVSIGHPITGCTFTIIDGQGHAVNGPVTGELLVSGPMVMRGYCNRPSLTDACMTQCHSGRKMRAYRTGDIVKRDADGLYHFVGRLDDMIKSRGYRIEPGEIENTLSRHVQVQEAVILALADPKIGNRLAALVVVHEGVEPIPSLPKFCAGVLPSHMIPTEIRLISKALPRTTNGKIDRAAALSIFQAGIP